MPRGIVKDKTALAIAVPFSYNAKLGDIAATYAAQGSCPTSCPLFNNGCYAQPVVNPVSGKMKISHIARVTLRLNDVGLHTSPIRIARAEARAIRAVVERSSRARLGTKKNIQGRPMRLHGVGDARTEGAVRTIAGAAEDYMAAGGGQVYTYTHGKVRRKLWGKVSVLASCESLDQADRAMRRGYAAAIVVEKHPADGKAYRDPATGIKVISCPNQTRDKITCSKCKLCMNDQRLLQTRSVIAFEAHGDGRESAVETIRGIQEKWQEKDAA